MMLATIALLDSQDRSLRVRETGLGGGAFLQGAGHENGEDSNLLVQR